MRAGSLGLSSIALIMTRPAIFCFPRISIAQKFLAVKTYFAAVACLLALLYMGIQSFYRIYLLPLLDFCFDPCDYTFIGFVMQSEDEDESRVQIAVHS